MQIKSVAIFALCLSLFQTSCSSVESDSEFSTKNATSMKKQNLDVEDKSTSDIGEGFDHKRDRIDDLLADEAESSSDFPREKINVKDEDKDSHYDEPDWFDENEHRKIHPDDIDEDMQATVPVGISGHYIICLISGKNMRCTLDPSEYERIFEILSENDHFESRVDHNGGSKTIEIRLERFTKNSAEFEIIHSDAEDLRSSLEYLISSEGEGINFDPVVGYPDIDEIPGFYSFTQGDLKGIFYLSVEIDEQSGPGSYQLFSPANNLGQQQIDGPYSTNNNPERALIVWCPNADDSHLMNVTLEKRESGDVTIQFNPSIIENENSAISWSAKKLSSEEASQLSNDDLAMKDAVATTERTCFSD